MAVWPFTGSVAPEEQFEPYNIDPDTEEFLRGQAAQAGADPNFAVEQYVQRMNNLGRQQVQGSMLSTAAQNIEAGQEVSPFARMRGAYNEAAPGTFEETVTGPTAYSPPPPNTEMAGPGLESPPLHIQGGPVAPETIDQEALQRAEWKGWDEETAARQWQPSQTIEELKEAAGLVVHDDDPANRYSPPPDPDEHLPDAFKGKHYRGGRQVAAQRGGGLGDASARAKAKGQTGSFTAGRMAPPGSASYDYVQQNESPAIQQLWKENRMTQLGLDMGQTEVDTARARADLLRADADEANLPYELRIKRQFDGMMQMHDSMKERLMPSVQAKIDKQMTFLSTDSEGMKLIDTPGKKKMVEEQLRRRYEGETFQNMMGMIIQLVMAQDPAGAARVAQEMERQRMFGGGAGAMIPGATP
jgi:hypothetical protein